MELPLYSWTWEMHSPKLKEADNKLLQYITIITMEHEEMHV